MRIAYFERRVNMNEKLKELLEYIIILIVVIAIVWFVDSYFIVNARIPSESMENTIMAGDRIIGNRLSYKTSIPKRFDKIIFRYPDDEKQLFIKRIIGLPGEKVMIIDGKVYINSDPLPLDDSFIKETSFGDFGPYEVPSNSYFVLGDNRNCSLDSRYWNNTFVKKEQILGKAVFRYYPFSSFGTLNNDITP